MAQMTDPADELASFERAFRAGRLPLMPARTDPGILVFIDEPGGIEKRFTYVTVSNGEVTAYAEFVLMDCSDDVPTFQLGYAVPEDLRNKGFATRLVRGAMEEMRKGLKAKAITAFVVNAVVGADDIAAQKVAARTLTPTPDPVADSASSFPTLHYGVTIAC